MGCSDKGDSGDTTTSSVVREAPYLWSNYSTSKNLEISEDFSAAEISNIEDMAEAWNSSVAGDKIFFTTDTGAPELSNTTDLDSLLDSSLGVYKTVNWPSELPSSALAVTQIFGLRKNTGTSNEFVDIQHADILVNYDIHQFDTADDRPDYDLRTVLLHELGHFLGLQHKATSSNRNSSIMYPSISSSENKRAPKSIDVQDIREKYNLDEGGVSSELMAEKNMNDSTGIPVKIIIELHRDGNCVHKLDDRVNFRHQVKLK